MFSINDLDITKSCETPVEFEVKDDVTGKGTGIFLSVLGGHSETVTNFVKKSLNERRIADAMAEKRDPRGKKPIVHLVEEDMEFSTEAVAIRIVDWRGLKEPFSHANAVRLCTINPPIKEQVLAVSEDLKNFPTPSSTDSAPPSDTPLG